MASQTTPAPRTDSHSSSQPLNNPAVSRITTRQTTVLRIMYRIRQGLGERLYMTNKAFFIFLLDQAPYAQPDMATIAPGARHYRTEISSAPRPGRRSPSIPDRPSASGRKSEYLLRWQSS